MAKVNITVDTETKEITAKLGDETLSNISSISICKYDDDDEGYGHRNMIYISMDESDDDVKRYTSVMASDKEVKVEKKKDKKEKKLPPWLQKKEKSNLVEDFLLHKKLI